MDALALVMLTIPIYYPVIMDLGYGPIWFGIIIVLVMQIGVITPSGGINVYVVYRVSQNAVGGIALESIFRGILPFMIAILAGIILFMLFPQIIMYLPKSYTCSTSVWLEISELVVHKSETESA